MQIQRDALDRKNFSSQCDWGGAVYQADGKTQRCHCPGGGFVAAVVTELLSPFFHPSSLSQQSFRYNFPVKGGYVDTATNTRVCWQDAVSQPRSLQQDLCRTGLWSMQQAP